MFGKKCWSCAEKIPKNAPYVTYKVRVKTQPLATDNYKNYKNRANQTDGGAIGANMSDVVSTMINTANADGGRVSDTLHVHSRINCIKYAIKAVPAFDIFFQALIADAIPVIYTIIIPTFIVASHETKNEKW